MDSKIINLLKKFSINFLNPIKGFIPKASQALKFRLLLKRHLKV